MRFWVFDSEKQDATGPYDLDGLRRLQGFGPETLVTPEGASSAGAWRPAGDFPELRGIRPSPPPMPKVPPLPGEEILPTPARQSFLCWADIAAVLGGLAAAIIVFFSIFGLKAFSRPEPSVEPPQTQPAPQVQSQPSQQVAAPSLAIKPEAKPVEDLANGRGPAPLPPRKVPRRQKPNSPVATGAQRSPEAAVRLLSAHRCSGEDANLRGKTVGAWLTEMNQSSEKLVAKGFRLGKCELRARSEGETIVHVDMVSGIGGRDIKGNSMEKVTQSWHVNLGSKAIGPAPDAPQSIQDDTKFECP